MTAFRDMGFHPEREEDEVLITTVRTGLFRQLQFETKRAGSEDSEGFVPVFIKRWEYEGEMAFV